ncbi:hypothetical protein [Brevibacillus sp. Leaf182]|nr:hypothetical protein [Brevibacillus sp. Leaf182]
MQREMSENLKCITIGQVLEYQKQRQEAKTMGDSRLWAGKSKKDID